ncbi:MAG TPA: PrsW family intramembrane metalloprotease [Firmicutes bacterium]|nr:PrsW family intramembrane metalloprotease [Bacillota bacterium]
MLFSLLGTLALGPVVILAFWYDVKDRYEKEPRCDLALGLLFGAMATGPVLGVDWWGLKTGMSQGAASSAFLFSAANEEAFKLGISFFLTWRNPYFNEPLDGIIYCVFVSLGFAAAENMIYVFHPQMGGIETALSRAVFSVPAHGLFGVQMGYYFGGWRYSKWGGWAGAASFGAAWLSHGLYNWILLGGFPWEGLLLAIFCLFLWGDGAKKILRHQMASPFRGCRGIRFFSANNGKTGIKRKKTATKSQDKGQRCKD